MKTKRRLIRSPIMRPHENYLSPLPETVNTSPVSCQPIEGGDPARSCGFCEHWVVNYERSQDQDEYYGTCHIADAVFLSKENDHILMSSTSTMTCFEPRTRRSVMPETDLDIPAFMRRSLADRVILHSEQFNLIQRMNELNMSVDNLREAFQRLDAELNFLKNSLVYQFRLS